jgi:hypothetical protein
MSYNFGQFRRAQKSSYSTVLSYNLTTIKEESPLSKAVQFNEKVVNLSGDNVLQTADETGLKKRYYYIKFKVYKKWDSIQTLTVQLKNTLTTADNTQTLTTIKIDKGYESDYSIFEVVIPPNGTYDQIQFILNRIIDDYSIINTDGTYGRIVNMEVERLEELDNVIDYLNPSISNKGQLKQIGVQGPVGLEMCIDGEGIRIGRSGIYEINNGIVISFLGFIVEKDDKKNFILDYQY